jgi:hypothetical protein
MVKEVVVWMMGGKAALNVVVDHSVLFWGCGGSGRGISGALGSTLVVMRVVIVVVVV